MSQRPLGGFWRHGFLTVRLQPQMKKYRCLWWMSTPGHNILYFFVICRILLLNAGICLWKAPNSPSQRGFPGCFPPEFVQHQGLALRLHASSPSLAPVEAGNKAGQRCKMRSSLCEIRRFERLPQFRPDAQAPLDKASPLVSHERSKPVQGRNPQLPSAPRQPFPILHHGP